VKYLVLLSLFLTFSLSPLIAGTRPLPTVIGSLRPARLQTPQLQVNTPPPELDLLIIIDQSASMDKTDPKSLRFQVLSYLLDTLSAYRAALSDSVSFRVAVLYFGADAQRVFDWTTILAKNDPAWIDISKQLNEYLATAISTTHREATDFLSAYQEAVKVFGELPASANSHQAIITLTDGAPCVYTADDPNCDRPASAYAQLAEVKKLVKDQLPKATLYIVSIDQANNYWRTFESRWIDIVGSPQRALKLTSSDEIGGMFLNILAELVSSLTGRGNTDVLGGAVAFDGTRTATIKVAPYYQQLRLTIFKPKATTPVSVIMPDGQTLTASSPAVSVEQLGANIEVWTIDMPIPGNWTLKSTVDTRLISVYHDLLRFTIVLSATPPYLLLQPVTLTMLLNSRQNQPLHPYSDARFALQTVALVAAPDGTQQNVPLLQISDGQYAATFTPLQVGAYKIALLASTQNLDGSPLTIVDNKEAGHFEVAAYQSQISGLPTSDLLVGQTISLNATLLGPDNKPIALQAQVNAQLLGTDSHPLAAIDLKASDPAHYTGDVVPAQAGQYTIKVRFSSLFEGKSILLAEQSSNVFSVRPVIPLAVRWDSPLADSTTDITIGFPPFTANPWAVTVQVLNGKDSTPLDLSRITNAAAPFTLTIENVKGEVVSTQSLAVDSTTPGRYNVAVRGLPAGTYTLHLSATTDPLSGDYSFDPAARTQTRTATLRTNPTVYAFYVGMGGIGLVLLGGAAVAALLAQRRRRHPLRGQIVIWYSADDNPGSPDRVWQAAFSTRRTNRYRVSANKLPRQMGLKRLILECSSDDMAARQGCAVTAELKTGVVKRMVLYPEDQQTLMATDDGLYEISKDLL